jgi:hypothetical protein
MSLKIYEEIKKFKCNKCGCELEHGHQTQCLKAFIDAKDLSCRGPYNLLYCKLCACFILIPAISRQ